MSEQALVPVEQKQVIFYDDEITAVLVEEEGRQEVYVSLRQLCDLLGVSYQGQIRRINDDPVLARQVKGVNITFTPSGGRGGGSQMTNCLPLDYLNGWLFGINANRVKEEIRDNLIRYQRECYRVLADAFLPPNLTVRPVDEDDQALMQLHNMALVIAATTREMLEVRRMALDNQSRLDAAREYLQGINRRLRVVEQRTQAGPLTEEQAREIQHRVNLIARELARHKPGEKHHMGVYEVLRQETGTTSYKSIPLKGYNSAIAFLDNWLQAVEQAEEQADDQD